MDKKEKNKITISKPLFITLMVVITLIGAYLRFWKIFSFPDGLFPDQAISGLEAVRGNVQPFYDSYGPHVEGLYIFLLRGMFSIFGTGVWQIFALTAAIGTVTVAWVMFIVARVEGRFVGLVTGLLMATSVWHIALSRSGFRVVMVPLILAALYYLWFLYWKERNKIHALLFGAIYGLGFYVYSSYSAIIILLILGFVLWFLSTGIRRGWERLWLVKKDLVLMLVSFLIVVFPYIVFLVQHPHSRLNRMQEVSIFSNRSVSEGILLLGKQTTQTLQGFFYQGDTNWRHNWDSQPHIQPVFSVFFIVGLITLLIRRNFSLIYLLTFAVFLLPAVLTQEGAIPHGNRMSGEIPVVFLITAIGVKTSLRLLQQRLAGFAEVLPSFFIGAAIAGLVYYSGSVLAKAYSSPEHASHFRTDLAAVASYLSNDSGVRDKLKRNGQVVVLATEFERFSLDFLLRNDSYLGIDWQMEEKIPYKPGEYRPLPTRVVRVGTDIVDSIQLDPETYIIVPAYGQETGFIEPGNPPLPRNAILDSLRDRYPGLTLVAMYRGRPASRYPHGIAFWIYQYSPRQDWEDKAVSRLTIEEKIGQLFLIGIEGKSLTEETRAFLTTLTPGGVILYEKNIETPVQLKQLTREISSLSNPASTTLPLFVAIDGEGGQVTRLRWQHESTSQNLVKNPDHAYKIAKQRGEELALLGVNVNLSPVIEPVVLEDSYIAQNGRAFASLDQNETLALALAMVRGYQDGGVQSVPKHFPLGLGATQLDPHRMLPRVENAGKTLTEEAEYAVAVAKPAGALMVTHLLYPAVDERPSSLSPIMVEKSLRTEQGFDGIIISDDITMDALVHLSTAVVIEQGIQAGVDMFIISGPREKQIEALQVGVSAVERGIVNQERLDQSLVRVLRFKRGLK